MFIALAVVSATLAALLVYSAGLKLSHRPGVVERYAKVGVREGQLNLLALVLLIGAAGLLAGLAWPVLGVAAALGLVAYFALAITAHIRSGDVSGLPVPVVMEILALVLLGLRLAER